MDYTDSLNLSLSTAVLINFPKPRFAVLPVSLGVELLSVGGTVSGARLLIDCAEGKLSVLIHDPEGERQHLHVCLLPDFNLNLKTTSLLGSRAKLQGELMLNVKAPADRRYPKARTTHHFPPPRSGDRPPCPP